jgi:hypothetical protein
MTSEVRAKTRTPTPAASRNCNIETIHDLHRQWHEAGEGGGAGQGGGGARREDTAAGKAVATTTPLPPLRRCAAP